MPGVELSTELDGVVVHILGYGFDLKSIELRQLLDEIQTFRVKRNRAILDKLKAKNMIITEEELLSLGDQRSIGRPHIAQLLLKKGYVFSFAQAFEMYLKDGASCYVSGFKITPAEAIAKIHEANGKAILAHPHFIKEQRILKKLLGLPFDGIECYYAMLSKTQEASWIALAKQRRWIATGGSDYHGTYKPYISLGASWVDWTTFQALV